MSLLPRFDEMRVETLREKCRERRLDGDGDKPRLVDILATFEINKIEAELRRNAPDQQKYIQLNQGFKLAVAARADQAYNVEKQYLLDEVEEIKAELLEIKAERDKEKMEGMKRYNNNRAELVPRKKGEIVAAQGKLGLSQEGVSHGKGDK
jgi:hypothetical protein